MIGADALLVQTLPSLRDGTKSLVGMQLWCYSFGRGLAQSSKVEGGDWQGGLPISLPPLNLMRKREELEGHERFAFKHSVSDRYGSLYL